MKCKSPPRLPSKGARSLSTRGSCGGSSCGAPTIAQGILGGLKTLIGGQIGAYKEMCEQAREQAFEEMVEHARQMGANAIIGVRYDTSEISSGRSR